MLTGAIICLIIFAVAIIVALISAHNDEDGGVLAGVAIGVIFLALSIGCFCSYYSTRGEPTLMNYLEDAKIYQIKGVCQINDSATILTLDGGDGKLICVNVAQTSLEAGTYVQKQSSKKTASCIDLEPVASVSQAKKPSTQSAKQ